MTEHEYAPNGLSDVDSARHDVLRAQRALSSRVREASVAGEAALARTLAGARPVLIGATVVTGVVVLVALLRRSRRPRVTSGVAERSLLGQVARTLVLSLATVAARRLAESIFPPGPMHSTSVGRGGSPQESSASV